MSRTQPDVQTWACIGHGDAWFEAALATAMSHSRPCCSTRPRHGRTRASSSRTSKALAEQANPSAAGSATPLPGYRAVAAVVTTGPLPPWARLIASDSATPR